MTTAIRPVWMRAACPMAVVCLVASCGSDPSGPRAPNPESPAAPRGLEVSAPVPASIVAGGSLPPNTTVAFVSAYPGTVVRAATAKVFPGGAAVVPVQAVDGGFDPVSMPAKTGDQIKVVVTDSAGRETTVTAMVKSGTRPRVVRTSPAPRRTDVPLNAIIRVVFSTPMSLESVREGVRLTREGTLVATEVTLAGGSGVAFDLVASALLAPASSYELEIAPTVEDVNGVPLGEQVTTDFTTTASVTPSAAASIKLVQDEGWLDPQWELWRNESDTLYARARSSDGILINVPITFTSDRPDVVHVNPFAGTGPWTRAAVTGAAPGLATISAISGQARASTVVRVFDRVDPTALTGLRMVTAGFLNGWSPNGPGVKVTDASTAASHSGGDHWLYWLEAPAGWWNASPMASSSGDIAFSRYLGHAEDFGEVIDSAQVVVLNPSGEERVFKATGFADCPAFSPDGSRIAFTDAGVDWEHIVVVGLVDGTRQEWNVDLSPGPDATGFDDVSDPFPVSLRCPRWSRDGRYVGLTPASVQSPGIGWVEPSRRTSNAILDLTTGVFAVGAIRDLEDRTISEDGRWRVFARHDGMWIESIDGTARGYLGAGWSPTFMPRQSPSDDM